MGTVAFHQAEALAALGTEVTVFTPAGDVRRSVPRAVEVVELQSPLHYGNAAFLPQILGRVRTFDLVHVHYPFFGTAEILALRRMLGGPPLVVQYQMDVVGDGWKAPLFRWHRRLVFPLILRAADRVLVTSVDYAESSRFLSSRMPALADKITVLPAGVDTATFYPCDREQARRDLRLPPGILVFFLSRLDKAHYFKGLHILVRALRRLPEATLVIGGDGELRSRYERHAAKHLGTRAIFVGDVADADLPRYYAAADVVVLPSIDRTEAFGLVLLEAMACGTPVVASRLRGVQTLVEDGANGFLVAPGNEGEIADKIAAAARDRSRMSAAALRVAAAFSWPDIAARLRRVYEDLTGAAGSPGAAG
jgi:glycosyltransferase involved in cell wall biosynthesis